MPCCIVCKKNSDTWERRSLHRFPAKDVELKGKWLKSLCLASVKKTDRVCCDHFSQSSFFKTLRSNRQVILNADAVPELRNYQNACIPSIDYNPSMHIDGSGSLMITPVVTTDGDIIKEKQRGQGGHFEEGALMNPREFQKFYQLETRSGFLSINEQPLTSPDKWESFQELMNVQQKSKQTKNEMHQSIKDREANTNINLTSYPKHRVSGGGGSSNLTEKIWYEECFNSNGTLEGRHVDSLTEGESSPSLAVKIEIKGFELPDVKEGILSDSCENTDIFSIVSIKEEINSEVSSEMNDYTPEHVTDTVPRLSEECSNDSVPPFCFVGIKTEETEESPNNVERERSEGLNEKSGVELSNHPSCVDIKMESEEDLDTNSRPDSTSSVHRYDMGHSSNEFIRGIECRDFPILSVKQEGGEEKVNVKEQGT